MAVDLKNHPGLNPEYFGIMERRKSEQAYNRSELALFKIPLHNRLIRRIADDMIHRVKHRHDFEAVTQIQRAGPNYLYPLSCRAFLHQELRALCSYCDFVTFRRILH